MITNVAATPSHANDGSDVHVATTFPVGVIP